MPSALWGGTPLLLTSRERRQAIGGKRVCKTMGEAPEVGAPKARKPRVSRWATRRVVHGPPRRGARGAKAPAQVFSHRGEAPPAGVEDPRPPGGSLPCAARYSEYTFPPEMSSTMAHKVVLRLAKLKSFGNVAASLSTPTAPAKRPTLLPSWPTRTRTATAIRQRSCRP